MSLFAMTVVAGLLWVDAPNDEAAKKELAKLQGTWRVVGVEENGQKVPEEALRQANGTVTIAGDKHTLKFGSQDRGTVTIKIDPTSKPKHYDMTIPEGAEKGKVQQGIYELEGDTWKLCLNKTGKGRPTEFAGKEGSGCVLVIMKKEKSDNGKN